tara:strand:- start:109 stop:342 length:234 start_codon:yes stop_codon:yes gene_type:complete
LERNISDDKIEVMKSYGWSKEIETSFFQFAEDIIGDRYKGKFFIKKILQTVNTLGTIISVLLKYHQEKSTCVVVILI